MHVCCSQSLNGTFLWEGSQCEWIAAHVVMGVSVYSCTYVRLCVRQSPNRSPWSQWWSWSPTQFPCSLTPSSEFHHSLSLSLSLLFSPCLSISSSRHQSCHYHLTLFSADYQPDLISERIITKWGHHVLIVVLRSAVRSRFLVSFVFAWETCSWSSSIHPSMLIFLQT